MHVGRLRTVDMFREEIKKLHAFWESEGNPNRGPCSKLPIGREQRATTGVMGAFVPSGVMVAQKILLTAESPQDVCDTLCAMKVGR